MYPPKPTNDPYTAVRCLWESLRRAADTHWGEQATVDPLKDGGFAVTIRLNQRIPPPIWKVASKYMRMYLRKERWPVKHLSMQRTHVRMQINYSPPTKKRKPHQSAGQAEKRSPQQRPTRLNV